MLKVKNFISLSEIGTKTSCLFCFEVSDRIYENISIGFCLFMACFVNDNWEYNVVIFYYKNKAL